MLKVIIDFDGTLTAEEQQALPLAERSLSTLANELIGVAQDQLTADYQATRAKLLRAPHCYWWEVNGLIASYCNEGAFILNTTTLQEMLRENPVYRTAVEAFFSEPEYDPIADCTNYLFHRHTAELPPQFRPAAKAVLTELCRHPDWMPVVLTNSMGDKVIRLLSSLDLDQSPAVLGDTRQYEMMPNWPQRFQHPRLGKIQLWPVLPQYPVDLRRPAYYEALQAAGRDGDRLAVVADTFSLPGALPLMMDIPFFLLRTNYTPAWCVQAVQSHPLGVVLKELADLPAELAKL